MTVAAAITETPYRQAFDDFIAHRREPERILQLRRDAFARFETLGLPTRQQEAWRITNLSALQPIDFQAPTTTPIEASVLPTLAMPTHRLVFVNGHFTPSLSQLSELADTVSIGSLAEILPTQPEPLESHLDQLPGLAQHPFAALNTAFWEDGAFIHLPPGTVVETPIHVVFYNVGDDVAVYPRLLLVLEKQAQATVVVEYRGTGRYLNTPLVELRVEQGATLHYHEVQENAPQAFHLAAVRLHQQRDSQAHLHLFSAGSQLARTDVEALLDGEGVQCVLNGLTLVRDQQVGDYHVRVEHAQPHGDSEQIFKSVLDDKARSVFDGMIHVHPHAQKTNARQLNRNLLLSKQAQASANPRLEILTDDVKCGHGSTTGFLNPDAEFYLRARGIGAEQARAMLVHAFANDSLNRMTLKPLRERLAQRLAAYLTLDMIEEEPMS